MADSGSRRLALISGAGESDLAPSEIEDPRPGLADVFSLHRRRSATARDVVTVNVDQRRLRQATAAVVEAGGIVRVEVRVSGAGGRHERVEFVRVRQDFEASPTER